MDDEGFVIRADVNQNDILQNKPAGVHSVRVYRVCVQNCVCTYSLRLLASVHFNTFILSAQQFDMKLI